jgi:hypothetical protein
MMTSKFNEKLEIVMPEIILPQAYEDNEIGLGCAYLVEGQGGQEICGTPRQASSSYCPRHHSLCYIPCGTRAEARRLREVETLASAVGGRRARQRVAPSQQFLERLEQAVRDFS